jgi:biopolymer transport protein ExbD
MANATIDRQHVPTRGTPRLERLLVMLMAAWLAMASGVGRHATDEARPRAPELRLQIEPSGAYALDGDRVEQRTLETALEQARARSPGLRLRIAAADGSDAQSFVYALASAQQAGIRHVSSEVH